MIRVTLWYENTTEEENERIKEAYPKGMRHALTDFLQKGGFEVRSAHLSDKENGLTDEVLKNTDVLIWWGHCKHDQVEDSVAHRVAAAVQKGMGAIFLHSAHMAKPFRLLMGTSCTLRWREANEKEIVWVTSPAHPIAEGLPAHFELEREEMYGEFFDVPNPEDTVFLGWFKGGNVFRSGITYRRGLGKVFYFQPGHETYPVYCNEYVQKTICNAVKWAHPSKRLDDLSCPNDQPLEKLS